MSRSFQLGKISQVNQGQDGIVRSAVVQYKNVDHDSDLKKIKPQETERSVNNLVVIVPADWTSDKIDEELAPSLP